MQNLKPCISLTLNKQHKCEMEARILGSSNLPDWESSSGFWWVAFCHGCRHNSPRRRCPLCLQPFTKGAGATPVTSWPSPKVWRTQTVYSGPYNSGRFPIATSINLKPQRVSTRTLVSRVLKSKGSIQMLPNGNCVKLQLLKIFICQWSNSFIYWHQFWCWND